MSISVATLGMFWSATASGSGGSGKTKIVYVDNGSSYGDLKKKIVIHVEKVHYDKYNKKGIKILAVKEE